MKLTNYIKNNKLIINILILCLIFFLLANSNILAISISNSVDIFLSKLIPALFPYLLITEVLINSGKVNDLAYGISKFLSKIFRVPICSTPCIIIGFLLGYPNSAKYILKLSKDNLIDSKSASKLVFFTSNANISYIICTIGIGMFKSYSIGIILLISHFLSAVILRHFDKKHPL